MRLMELKRYREIVLFAKYVNESQTNSGILYNNGFDEKVYNERREQIIAYLDEQTNTQFDLFKEKDEKGNIINKPKVLKLTLFQ